MTTKFSQFANGTTGRNTDTYVGLRAGVNTRSTLTTGIQDGDGNYLVGWTSGGALAINYLNITTAVSGSDILLDATSSDADVGVAFTTKGSGDFTFTPGTTGELIISATTAIRVPGGTTVQRPIGALGGFRYNTDTDFLEYWDVGANAWVDIIAGAAFDTATYITQTDETADLPNSQPLSALSTGIMYSTTTTGVVGTRTLTGTTNQVDVANGTGAAGNPTFTLSSTLIFPGNASFDDGTLFFYDSGGINYASISAPVATYTNSVDYFLPIDAPSVNGYVLSCTTAGVMSWIAASTGSVTDVTATSPLTSTGGATPDIAIDTMTNGQLIIGSTGLDPVIASLTAGAGIAIVVGAGSIEISATDAGVTNAVTTNITQANAFTGGEWVYLTGGVYTAAANTSAAVAEVVGVVAYSPAPTATTFTLQTNGELTGATGLTADTVYFLGTAGALTSTQPTTPGLIVKPLLVGNSTTSGIMINFRGDIIPTPLTANRAVVTSGTGALTVSATTDTEISYVSGVTSAIQTQINAKLTGTIATQAEQETGTSITAVVTSGRQQYHASAAKAWCSFNTVTTTAILSSYNVTSLTDNGTGDTTINFTTAFSSTEYAFTLMGGGGAGDYYFTAPYTSTPTASAFRCIAINPTGRAAVDLAYNASAFFGDQ